MNTQFLLRLGRIILFSIFMAGLMLSSIGGLQSVKGLGALPEPNLPAIPGAVITVGPSQSIQNAVNTAATGSSINVSGDHASERVTVNKSLSLYCVDSCTVRGFVISANNVTVNRFTIINLYDTGVVANSGSNGVIENNEFLYNGNRGLILSDSTSGWTIHNNRFHRNNIAGAEIRGNNHMIEGNEVTHTIQYSPCVSPITGADADGFRFHGGGHVFRNNWVHDMPDGGPGYNRTECSIAALANLNNDYDDSSHTDCWQTFDPAGHDILFEGNVCELPPSSEWSGGWASKAFQGSGNVYNLTFKNNLVVADFLSLFYDCSNVVYDHNTFIGSGSSSTSGIKYYDCGGDAGSAKNNIFYGIVGGSQGHFEIVNSSPSVGYNSVYIPGKTPRRSADPGDVWNVNPRLDNNYHLLSDSPCRGAAEAGSDIGAFPYGGGLPPQTVTHTPIPPTATKTAIPSPSEIPTFTPTNTPVPVIPSPTSTAVPTNVNSPSPLPGLSWEAEQGEITAPFVAVNGIVSQSVLTDNPVNGGRALYRFTIQDAGEYIVKANVNAADSGRNSFFVGIDKDPDTSMIWDVILTNGFEERTVSWREGAGPEANAANPKVFSLTPGEHTLIFRGREANTLLDKVEVARAPIIQPTNTPMPTATLLPTQTPTITVPPTTEVPQGPTLQPTNTAIPTVTHLSTQTPTFAATPTVAIAETSTPTAIVYTNTPLPTETPLPTFTATPSDATPPTITNITNNNTTQWLVTFSEDIGATGSNRSNFRLNGARGGQVVIDSISYDNSSYITMLNVNGGNLLPPDDYTLTVAGSTSVTDLAGNKLDGNADGIGGDDFVHGFSVQAPTAIPTETPLPASPTPTETPAPPTATATETPVPATSTPTPEPPTATMTASPVPPSPTPTATLAERVYDDTDSSFLYSSGWNDEWRRSAYGGSFKQTTQAGSYVTFTFTGQSFSILYKSGRESRTMDVYVDGALVGSINQRDWKQAFQERWDYPGLLAPGTHTLKLVFVTENNKGRTNGSFDAVIVR